MPIYGFHRSRGTGKSLSFAEEAAIFAGGLQLNFGMRDQRRDWFDFLARKGLWSGSFDPVCALMDAPVP